MVAESEGRVVLAAQVENIFEGLNLQKLRDGRGVVKII